MRKLILMTSAAVIAPISAIAQTPTCTATPDCASLGYTEASCPNGGVKCPWGDTWFCGKDCSDFDFKYTCTGTGYAGGAGDACDGKYTSCHCSSPYAWDGSACSCPSAYQYSCTGDRYVGGAGEACNGKYTSCKCTVGYCWIDKVCGKPQATLGQCTGYAAQCSIGDILFSDGTCSADVADGKTPIAVVVYISDDGCGQALALNDVVSGGNREFQWAPCSQYGSMIQYPCREDVTALPNLSEEEASQDFASCDNCKKIATQSCSHPARDMALKYTTTGTNAGDWCLPAAGIFTSYINNKEAIDTGFRRAGGEELSADTWSSSEAMSSEAWRYEYNNYISADGLSMASKNNYNPVRPVIEF